MSAMNRMLRNSEGISIIVGRLDRAKAEDKEGYRRKGAPGAVNSENIQSLNLHTRNPQSSNFDARITLQPKIAGSALHKSRSVFLDLDIQKRLVKTPLGGSIQIEIILNRI
jgi:hypothetical protein